MMSILAITIIGVCIATAWFLSDDPLPAKPKSAFQLEAEAQMRKRKTTTAMRDYVKLHKK